jgi:hypothetical protein
MVLRTFKEQLTMSKPDISTGAANGGSGLTPFEFSALMKTHLDELYTAIGNGTDISSRLTTLKDLTTTGFVSLSSGALTTTSFANTADVEWTNPNGSGGSPSALLAAVPTITAGEYSVPTLTVDAKGRVTAIASGAEATFTTLNATGGGSLTGTWSDLGTITTVDINGGTITGITDLAVADGGTGSSTAAGARTNLGVAIGSNVQAYDAGLNSIAGLVTAADRMIYTTASDTYAVATLTAAGRAILDDADASAQRTTLGLGTIATQAASSVAITGGTINGVAGTFTDLASTGNTTLGDASGDTVLINAKSTTRPNMPAFSAYLSSSTSNNVTGDGTEYTIVCDTEVFDRGGDFASGTFTAPITGIYQINAKVVLANVAAAHSRFLFKIVTSNRSYIADMGDLQPDANNRVSAGFSVLADMDASDTATFSITVIGSTKTVGVLGTTEPWTAFSGYMVG